MATAAKKPDTRMSKSPAANVRGSRGAADAQRVDNEGTAVAVSERPRLLASEFLQEALPEVPPLPGYHMCWLSATSSYDPIHKRMRMGYTPVRVEEVKGFNSFKMTSGEFEGCISCNEMLLFKIEEEVYQAIMREYHHDQPLREEESLRSQAQISARDSAGKPIGIVEGDGFEQLADKRVMREFA